MDGLHSTRYGTWMWTVGHSSYLSTVVRLLVQHREFKGILRGVKREVSGAPLSAVVWILPSLVGVHFVQTTSTPLPLYPHHCRDSETTT